jgi:Co/Zn/Cd efflux system component
MVQSIGVILISLTIYFKPNWIILDPIISMIFIIISLIFTYGPAQEIFCIFLNQVPKNISLEIFNQ